MLMAIWLSSVRCLGDGVVMKTVDAFGVDDAFDVKACSDELRDLADYVRFSIDNCPSRRALFRVDGVDLDRILDTLATRLDEHMNDCPCIGPCEQVDCE